MKTRCLVTALVVVLVQVPMLLLADPAGAALSRVFETTYGGQNWRSSPTIADVNGDGVNDIVVADRNGVVRAVNASGQDLPGWPQQVNIAGTNTGVDSSPTVADLDNDGVNEVIVGAGLLGVDAQHGGVVVFNHNGSVRWAFQTKDRLAFGNGFSDAVWGTPAVGDVSGDGFPDVVFGSFDHEIYVLDRNGGVMATHFNNDTIFSSPALIDFDFDKRAEILIGADSSGWFVPNGGILWMLEYQGEQLRTRWRVATNDIIQSSPAIGELDGDGTPEVVFGTGNYWGGSDRNRVFALNAENGTAVGGWPVTVDGQTMAAPAIGDLNGDGANDVAVATCGCGGGSSKVHGITGTGGLMWSVDPADGTRFGAGDLTNGPVIADVNGDGHNDVVQAGGSSGFVRDGRNGALVDTFDEGRQHINTPAVGQFGSSWRLVSASFVESANQSHIAAYAIAAPGTAPPWPMFRRNAQHTGGPPNPGPGGAGGYYVLDTQGDVYAFGTARHFGSVPILRAHGTPIGNARSVSISGTSDGGGAFILDDKGGMFTFGNAKFFGSVPGLKAAGALTGDVTSVALAVTSDNLGYWVLDTSGGVNAFGNAGFHGSVASLRSGGAGIGNAPSIALAVTTDNQGYWVLDDVGGMFTFGNASFFGSVPQLRNSGVPIGPANVVGMAPTASGNGYWMVDDVGGMFAFGDAPFLGSIPQLRQQGVSIGPAKIIGMVPTPSGNGYYLFDDKGGIFAFGDATFAGSLPGVGVDTTAVSVTPYRGS